MESHPKMKRFNQAMQHPACLNGLKAIYQALEYAKLDGEVCVMIGKGPIFALKLNEPKGSKDENELKKRL